MPLLNKLIDSLQEGRKIPLKHSFLIASGIENKRVGENYLKKFDRVYNNYVCFTKGKGRYNTNNLEKAKLLSEFLTNPIKYKKNKFLFPEVIDARLSKSPFSRHGNCVGLTSLYNALAEEEGIYTCIYKQRDHILSRVIISGKEYAIENSYSYGFNVKVGNPAGKGSNLDLLADILLSRHFSDISKELEILELAKKISPRTSLIYFNSAIIYYSAGETKKSLLEVDKAIEIDPFNPKQYEFKYKLEKLLGDKSGARRDKRKYKELIRRSA